MKIKSQYFTAICLLWLSSFAITSLAQPHRLSTPWVKHSIGQWLEPDNLWVAIARDFKFPTYTNRPEVQAQINWYQGNSFYLMKMAEHAQPYMHYIYQQVHDSGLPPELALIPFIESEFDPYAFSHAGATGLWQIMPNTGSGFGLQRNWWYDGRRDLAASTKAALNYLKYLGEYFHGDWLLAIAAYDSGQGTVQNALKRAQKQNKDLDFWSLSLPRETKQYIPRLLALAAIIAHPDRYGIELPVIKNEPYLEAVDIGSQLDLSYAAELAGIELEEIYHLNPGFNHWATSPAGPHRLLLPIEQVEAFRTALTKLPQTEWMHYDYHTVKSGESLGQIARRYKVTSTALQRINQLKNAHNIHVGQKLKIPPRNRKLAKAATHFNKKQQRHTLRGRRLPTVHTVRKGETLSGIAARYHLSTKQLIQRNHLKNSNKIRSGQKIALR